MRSVPFSTALALLLALMLAPMASAQSAGPPDAATASPTEPAAELPPDLPSGHPAHLGMDGAMLDGAPGKPIPLAFRGLWSAPGEAAFSSRVESLVYEALQRRPFVPMALRTPLAPACLEDVSCLKMKVTDDARWTIVGSLTAEATQLKLSLVLIEPRTGARYARASIAETSNREGQERLLASVEPVVRALVQTLDPGAGPAVPEDVPVSTATATATRDNADEVSDEEVVDEAPASAVAQTEVGADAEAGEPAKNHTEAAEGSDVINYGAWIWSAAFLGAGAFLAVGGIAFDLFSPTSVDAEITFIDGLGPGMVLAGASVALVGLAVNPFLWMALAEDDDEG